MQKTVAVMRGIYRERLSPSLWVLGSTVILVPMVALALSPLGSVVALVIGLGAGAAVLAGLIALSPVVEVRDGELRAGRAHIPVRFLANLTALDGDAARLARGPELSPRSWHLIRGGVDGIVTATVTDPDDPVTNWVISSRTPDRLVAAIRSAQAQSTQIGPEEPSSAI